jgi:hypothetical protein
MDIEQMESDMDKIMDLIMTTEEAGETWGLSQDRVKRLCGDGTVIARKRGKTWLLLREQDNPKQRERNND